MLDFAGENRSVAIHVFNEVTEQFRILIVNLDSAFFCFLEVSLETLGEPF
jgi:hypothetical protein